MAELSKPNLLHNWDFRNPVNQRGALRYTPTGGAYTIDRWLHSGGTYHLDLMSGGISIENTSDTITAYLVQYYENRLPNGKYTVSCMLTDGTLYAHSYELLGSNTIQAHTPFGRFVTSNTTVIIAVNPEQTAELQSVKVELGEHSTLAADPPMDYGKELAVCQRYQISVKQGTKIRASYISPNYIDFFIPTPVPMRVTPIISINSIKIYTTSGIEQTDFSYTVLQHISNLGMLIRASKVSHGLTDCFIDIAVGGITLFDANL